MALLLSTIANTFSTVDLSDTPSLSRLLLYGSMTSPSTPTLTYSMLLLPSLALTTVTSALQWAFEHAHDEFSEQPKKNRHQS